MAKNKKSYHIVPRLWYETPHETPHYRLGPIEYSSARGTWARKRALRHTRTRWQEVDTGCSRLHCETKRHRGRGTERQRVGETDEKRQTDRQTDRQTESERERERERERETERERASYCGLGMRTTLCILCLAMLLCVSAEDTGIERHRQRQLETETDRDREGEDELVDGRYGRCAPPSLSLAAVEAPRNHMHAPRH